MKTQKEKIRSWPARIGQLIARRLHEWINPLSPATKKKGLITIGILIGITSMMLVEGPFRRNEASSLFNVDRITRPADIFPRDTIPHDKPEYDIIRQYNRMIRFKELMDSLSSPANQKTRDSVMKAHPGLRDSLNEFLKQSY